jgi:catechol 2,3-dioxygenase-like lactoylglutathione lyase family enzyme
MLNGIARSRFIQEERMAARKKTSRKTDARSKTAPARTSPRRTSSAKGRAPQALKLGTASPNFTVNDLEKSLAWYTDVLGFRVKERWERDGKLMGVEIAAGSVSFYLGQDDWKKGRRRAKGAGFRMYCTTTQDVDALAERIRAAGGTLAEEPHDEPWGGRSLAVEDPDGFKITVSRD